MPEAEFSPLAEDGESFVGAIPTSIATAAVGETGIPVAPYVPPAEVEETVGPPEPEPPPEPLPPLRWKDYPRGYMWADHPPGLTWAQLRTAEDLRPL